MKILQVIPSMNPGGAERIVLQLVADGTARGDDVVVASCEGAWVPRIHAAGAAHVAMPFARSSRLNTTRWTYRLAAVLRRFRPDLVHTHNVRATVATRLAMVTTGMRPPFLSTVHGLAPPDYPTAARFLRLAGCQVIACAPSVGRSLVGFGLPADRVNVIPNGAALSPVGSDRLDALRATLGVGARPLVVGMGRLVAQKSWSTLIEAARDLPDVDIVVAGEGPFRGQLECTSQTTGVGVRFVGEVEDPAAFLGVADCLVSTSTWEGLPLSLLEALSLGVPTVATAVDGVRDVIPLDAALLVPPADPRAVAVAVQRVLADAGLARRLSERALAAAREWSPEAMLVRYRAAYEAALPAGR